MSAPAREQPVCTCGLPMQLVNDEYFHCPNCDVPQEPEYLGLRRRRTDHDTKFNVIWDARIKKIYRKKGK